jgi:uncharacterized protein YggU (UPF0235/DUF167 family)
VVAVAAPAVDGKANEALCRALADAFDVRRSAITIVRGATGRDKTVEVAIDPARGEAIRVRLQDG